MVQLTFSRTGRQVGVLIVAFTLAMGMLGGSMGAGQGRIAVLRIGSSGTLNDDKSTAKEKSALETLRRFIKDETGMDSEILRQSSWRELTEKLAKGQLQLGVFQGYEFAWAQEKSPELKPLALAVNVELYPVVYVMVQKTNKAKDFASLAGQSIAIPATGQRYLQLFVEHECQASGTDVEKYFSKVTRSDNIEDALDDVVDGTTQVTVADQGALDAFKRRKPARFAKLKEVVKSQPFPPALVACYGKFVDEATLKRFKDGLLGASKKDQGQTVLTLFRLTEFQAVPDDFARVLAETRKIYPTPPLKAK